jgi:hypothetical protein
MQDLTANMATGISNCEAEIDAVVEKECLYGLAEMTKQEPN